MPAPPLTLLDRAALFLDFDGTLIELAESPDAIDVPAHLPDLLGRLSRSLGDRLAIVTGRSLADLERHLPLEGVACAGSHGLEIRLPGGPCVPVAAPEGMAEARARASDFGSRHPGLLIEEKPAGIALHYRRAPAAEAATRSFAAELAESLGWTLQLGKMVAEVRPSGASKGDAMIAILAEPPFAGARPVFVGDDITDEAGFAAAAEAGGAGILVGPERPTAARYRLDSVAALARWLESRA
jgi:trehalose 6-phosphate phosphatase